MKSQPGGWSGSANLRAGATAGAGEFPPRGPRLSRFLIQPTNASVQSCHEHATTPTQSAGPANWQSERSFQELSSRTLSNQVGVGGAALAGLV